MGDNSDRKRRRVFSRVERVGFNASDEWGRFGPPHTLSARGHPGAEHADERYVSPWVNRVDMPNEVTKSHGSRSEQRAERRGARTAHVTVEGVARAVQQRSLGGQTPNEILSFRVERYDGAGNRMPPVPVELRGSIFGARISGQLSDGDGVEVTGIVNDGTLRAEKILNRSTGAVVEGRSGWDELSENLSGADGKRMRRVLVTVFTVIAVCVAAAIIGTVLFIRHSDQEFREHQQQIEQDFQQTQQQSQDEFQQRSEEAERQQCRDMAADGFPLPARCRRLLGAP